MGLPWKRLGYAGAYVASSSILFYGERSAATGGSVCATEICPSTVYPETIDAQTDTPLWTALHCGRPSMLLARVHARYQLRPGKLAVTWTRGTEFLEMKRPELVLLW